MLKSAFDENEAAIASGKPWLATYAVADDANVVDRARLEAELRALSGRITHGELTVRIEESRE